MRETFGLYIADTTGNMAIAFLIPLVCYGMIGGYAATTGNLICSCDNKELKTS